MNINIKRYAFALIPIFVSLLPACNSEPAYKKLHGDTQGTTYNITYQDKINRDIQPEIDKLLREFELSLSGYEPNSILSRINKNDITVIPDKYFIEVFRKSYTVFKESEGAFDITVSPIVNVWGFGPQKSESVDSTIIDSLLQFVGMEKVKLENGRVVKENPGIQFDVNAIAQGYSVDLVGILLESKGVINYMVEIGGELKTKGVNPKKQPWKIGIDKPIENSYVPGEDLQAIVEVSNKSVATSGNYRKFYEKDGVKYAHIINPKIGYPVFSNLLSVTVVADDCMTADAWATAFMVMGLEKTIQHLEKHTEMNAYLIYSDAEGLYKTFVTRGLQKTVSEITDH